ncbi:hypothetical protein FK220_017845 [Flavobacteriaceae bacterium TP-CH-4]|uniref:Uncharacterized protein n=1 Tax=Pelagihabitans pacificus TaxID=2696054 RepID=A0A967AXP4_9FLAO|nr:DUF6768 family protein [Pelagihabitans pacificus]NHF61220.1 hypothetical protein [Pelagihabitans pacificus]
MKKEMNKIDELIKETLDTEEARFYDELEEQNLMGKLGQAHRGKTGWLVSIMTVAHLLIFVAFIYCIVQFFNTQVTNELVIWSAAGFICMIAMAMLKLYVWMQMDKNDLLRELKRLELQISALSHRLDK